MGNLYLRKGATPFDDINVGPTFHKGPEGLYTAKVAGVLWSMKEHWIKAIMR